MKFFANLTLKFGRPFQTSFTTAGGDKEQEQETLEELKAKTNAALLKAKLDTGQLTLFIETAEKAKLVSLVFFNPPFIKKVVVQYFNGLVSGHPEEGSDQGC